MQNGFVLITSLLVLVVVSALGAGAVFLTITNLRIAENTRTTAIARYNAERGLDLALLTLAREFAERDGSWPTEAELKSLVPVAMTLGDESEALDYAVVRLEISGADPRSGVVAIEGRGGANGLYRTSARFRGSIDDEDIFDFGNIADLGMVTPGQLIAHGNAKFGLNVHVGTGIVATGRARLIDSVTLKSATEDCSIGSGANRIQCEADAEMPIVPRVDFAASRASFTDRRPNCDATIEADTTAFDLSNRKNETICVADGVSLEVTGTATGVYIIGAETSTVIIRADATPPENDTEGVGLKVVSGTVIPDVPGAMGIGENTIIARNSINLARDVFAGVDGIVRTYVATEGDIRFAGAGMQQLYGVFHANGDVCTQGTLEVFYGSILAGAERSDGVEGLCENFTGIDFRGNGALDAFRRPQGASNEDFPQLIGVVYTYGLVVVSRQ